MRTLETLATLPIAIDSVLVLGSRVFTSSSGSLAHYAVCLTRVRPAMFEGGPQCILVIWDYGSLGQDAIDACVDTHAVRRRKCISVAEPVRRVAGASS